jgi:polyhydroxyalkanoate synthesis regulator protein
MMSRVNDDELRQPERKIKVSDDGPRQPEILRSSFRGRTIKRYANRKFYDPEVGGYVTLGDLVSYVKNDVIFEVIDREDNHRVITSEVLAMAIHFHLRKGEPSSRNNPLELLTHIIKFL